MTGSRQITKPQRKATAKRLALPQLQPKLRELAHRVGADIEVSLFWRPADNSLLLLLVEVPTGVVFEFPVAHEEALDAFNHPYAYLPVRSADPWAELLAA
jgi:hypothetical protein